MAILTLVRNQIPAHEQIVANEWNVAQIARNAFDLEGKVVGTVGAGRIGWVHLQIGLLMTDTECCKDFRDLTAKSSYGSTIPIYRPVGAFFDSG